MDWSNERYVRVYTRDTPDWLLWSWQARAVLPLLLRKVDRAGVMDLGRHGLKAVAASLGLPLDVVTTGMGDLAADGGPVVMRDDQLVVANFLEAQEARQSDGQRQRESRRRRRDLARGIIVQDGTITKRDAPVTKRDAPVTKRSGTVTTCHNLSQPVTPNQTSLTSLTSLTRNNDHVSSPADRPPTSKPKTKNPQDAYELADLLADHIRSRQPDNRTIGPQRWKATREKWATSIRLMHSADGRPWGSIRNAIAWSQQDEFWAANILSAQKLRAKYDTMAAQRQRGAASALRSGPDNLTPEERRARDMAGLKVFK